MPRWRKRNATEADLSFSKPIDSALVTDELLLTATVGEPTEEEPNPPTEPTSTIAESSPKTSTDSREPLSKISKRGTERTSIFTRLSAPEKKAPVPTKQPATNAETSKPSQPRRGILERLGDKVAPADPPTTGSNQPGRARKSQDSKPKPTHGDEGDDLIIAAEDDPDLNPEGQDATLDDKAAGKPQRVRGFLQAITAIKEAPDAPVRPEPRHHQQDVDRRRKSRDGDHPRTAREDRRRRSRDKDDKRDKVEYQAAVARDPVELALPEVDDAPTALLDDVHLVLETGFDVIVTPPSSDIKLTAWDVRQELQLQLEHARLAKHVMKIDKVDSPDHRLWLKVWLKSSSYQPEVQACIEQVPIKQAGMLEPLFCRCPPRRMAQLVLNPFVGPFSAGLRGERADTVLLRNLPCLWFGASKGLPSDEVLRNAFASFGAVAKVVALHSQGSSKDDDDFAALMNINFDVYVQYESVEAVLALLATCHGRELQRTRNDKVFKARIEACLDTSEYLSKRNIRKRKQEAEMVEVRRKEEIARKQREAEEAARLEAERIAQEQEDRRLAAIKRQERLAKEEEERRVAAEEWAEAERQRLKEEAERERLSQIAARKRAILAAEEQKKQEAETRRRLAVEAAQKRAFAEMKAKLQEEDAKMALEEEELSRKRALEEKRLAEIAQVERATEAAEDEKRAAMLQKLKDLENRKAEERRQAALARLKR